MNSDFIPVLLRAIVIVLLQGLVLQRIALAGPSFNYISIILYPVVLMLFPINSPRVSLILAGFALGISIDVFYGSFGVHAGACVFTAFARPFVLQALEPRGGYPVSEGPTLRDFDLNWFMRYTALILAVHLPVYFALEVFSFAYFGQIILKALVSFAISFPAIIAFMLIFNPKR